MSRKIIVSKQGINAGTATSPNDFIFHSDYNTFKIVSSGTISSSVTSDPTTITVAHGQSKIPAVYAFAKYPDGFVTMPNSYERAGTTPDIADRRWYVEADATNVNFVFYKGGGANYSPIVNYYIFESPLN